MKKLALHWWILLAMAAGIGYGIVAAQVGATDHVLLYIRPVGTLFLNLLKMIAVPLVLFSLVAGVASLNDTSKLGRIGGRTVALYLGTTAMAITIGLLVAAVLRPGAAIAADPQIREGLQANFGSEASAKLDAAAQVSILDHRRDRPAAPPGTHYRADLRHQLAGHHAARHQLAAGYRPRGDERARADGADV
jgi:Na+/H+-dicarboxylate symporter